MKKAPLTNEGKEPFSERKRSWVTGRMKKIAAPAGKPSDREDVKNKGKGGGSFLTNEGTRKGG